MTQPCPVCGVGMTSVGYEDVTPNEPPRPPKNGDLALCPTCTHVLVIVDGTLLPLTPAQVQMLKPDVVAAVQKAQVRLRGSVQ